MIERLRGPRRDRQLGQVLPLTAIFMFVLLGISALVLDVARVYVLKQFERSVADAAALTGAQDLVTKDSHVVPSNQQYKSARTDALALAARTLGGTVDPSCNPNSDVPNCQIVGTPYQVSVETPTNSAMTVSADRAVQVTVRQPDVGLTFARLLGQHDWNVAITSVAGLGFGDRFALITLRPPHAIGGGGDNNSTDITVNGGTVLTVSGDIGSNTNAVISGQGASGTNSQIVFFPSNTDFALFHFDTPIAWTPPPAEQPLTSLIPDPGYPTFDPANPPPGTPPGGQDTTNCDAAIAAAKANGYVIQLSSSNSSLTEPLDTPNATTCWKPGVYSYDIGGNRPGVNSSNTTAILLEPGVYFLNGGLSIGGTLIGGYTAGSYDATTSLPNDHTGVSLIFPEANNLNGNNGGQFQGANATLIALNAGSCITSNNPGTCLSIATPAVAPDGTNMQVTLKSKSSGDVTVPESLVVSTDTNCKATVQPYNTACNDTGNKTMKLPGGGSLFLFGVQYMPSDNVTMTGGSSGSGFLGKIVAWTVNYTGGSAIGEVYPGHLGNGTLRLDPACSGPNTNCIAYP
jgi:Putative Flp pilus-assembly TadE/G-like